MTPTPKKVRGKKVKAWAVVNEHGLTWSIVEPVNGEFGSGLALPNISTNRGWIRRADFEVDEKIIPCTITYALPTKRKRV